MVDTTRPKAIVGTAPLTEYLIEKCPNVLGKDIGALGIKILLCAGAPGAGIPSIRKKIEDGVIGHGICTALEHEAKPFLKYAWGDLFQVFTKECPGCGFKGLRVRIVGRADEMLIVKGVNVYPTAIKGVINTFLPRVTGEMRIVLDAPGPMVQTPLKLGVEHAPGLGKEDIGLLREELAKEIRSKLEVRPDIELVAPDTFERAGGISAKGTLVEKKYKTN